MKAGNTSLRDEFNAFIVITTDSYGAYLKVR